MMTLGMGAVEYVFAGGGTGGHLFPGIAVADALRRADPEAGITFFTTTRALDRELLDPTAYAQIEQPVRPATLKPWKLPGFWFAWRASVATARTFLRDRQPHAVLGLGGYAAGPAVVAARRLGIRTAILNPDAVPGRANRYLARLADLVVLQWELSRKHFSTAVNCQTLGCPIRSAFSEAQCAAGRQQFGLDPDRPVLLATGASQGARTVNRTMYHVWPKFAEKHPDWQLLHLSGPADEDEARAAYGRCGAASAHVVAFTHEMWLALAAADAVVSRAGASTLAELTALGKPAVLLPYPYHRDQHQRANAQVLVDAGAAILVDDQRSGELNSVPVLAALERVAAPGMQQTMAAAARRLGRPSAAEVVAAWLRG